MWVIACRLSIMVASDEGLTTYLSEVLKQIGHWLQHCKLQKLVLVISSIASREVAPIGFVVSSYHQFSLSALVRLASTVFLR